MHVRSTPDKNI